MTQQEAWDELTNRFPHLVKDGLSPLYFWEPGQGVPVDERLTERDHEDGWEHISAMEDIPIAYLAVRTPRAIGQLVVYAKWPRQGWDANPQTRHLINHLIQALAKVQP